jgi:hypothetical protein
VKRLLLAIVLLLATAASAFEQRGNTIVLTPKEAAACAAQGGCVVAPKDVLSEAIRKRTEDAFAAGTAQGFQAGQDASCKRKYTFGPAATPKCMGPCV